MSRSSSRFRTSIRSMPSLKTPNETITNIQANGTEHNPSNDQANQTQEEPIAPSTYTLQSSENIAQPNAISILLPSNTHEVELQRRLNEMEKLIRRIHGIPTPIKKSFVDSYADSPFTDNIALVEMPYKFSFPNMKLYNRTSDPDNHIAQYKQHMFTTAIPRDIREACICKGFGSSLIGLALPWYTISLTIRFVHLPS